MSRPKKKFASTNTTTPGKLKTIAKQVAFVKSRYGDEKWSGLAVSIPGRGPQMPRHITEMTDCGAKPDNIVFLDHHIDVVKSMRRKAKQIGWDGCIVKEDLFKFINDQWAAGEQIDIIDCDDTGVFKKQHIDMLREACKRNVKVVNIVLTTRCNTFTPYMHGWKCALKLSRFNNKASSAKKKSQPIRDITVGAIRRTAEKYGYNCKAIKYAGRGDTHPMVACVIVKN